VVRAPPVKEPASDRIKAIRRNDERGTGQRELISATGDRKRRSADRHDPEPEGHGRECIYVRSAKPRPSRKCTSSSATAGDEYTTIVSGSRPGAHPTPVMAPFAAARWGALPLQRGHALVPLRRPYEACGCVHGQLSLLLRRHQTGSLSRATSSYLQSRFLERAMQVVGRERRPAALTALPMSGLRRATCGLHPDERDLDHRRSDLPPSRPLLLGRAARPINVRHLRVTGRPSAQDKGDEKWPAGCA